MKIRKMWSLLIRDWPAKILSLALAVLLFYFYKINTTEVRYITVPLEIILDSGFIPADSFPEKARISLRGSSESLLLITDKDISAYADFSSRRQKGTYREPVIIRKSGQAQYADPLEIKVQPSEIYLKIEERLIKTLEVVPVIRGFPADNYELTDYSVAPDNIMIEGPLSAVEKLNMLKTEPINIDGKSQNFTQTVKIDLDNRLINFLERSEVQFRGRIEKTLVVVDIAPVPISVVNGDSSMIYELEVQSGNLKVEADKASAGLLGRETCSLYVDMNDVSVPGVYNMPVNALIAQMEGKQEVLGFSPETVRVYVTKNRRY